MTAPTERSQGGATALQILLVAEVRLFREGLARELSREPDVDVVEAAAALEASARLSSLRPHIVLADASTVCRTDLGTRAAAVGARVVAFAVEEEDEQEVLACAEAGVAGMVARDSSLEELIAVIRTAARGEVRCSPRVAALVIRRVARLASVRVLDDRRMSLTRREREIASFIDHGLSNKEIASALGIETATVKNHVHNLLEKLQVRRRGEVPSVLRAGARERPAAWDHLSHRARVG